VWEGWGEKGETDKVKKGERDGVRAGGLYLFRGAPEFPVTPLLMGPVCRLSQSRFEKPVRP